jgi:UDP-2,4-diacetamido-2,4,6-trideoxy-beta-L-altropyranose hydrolase
MKPILFRCDASISIGSGHVMRCRTLARELSRRGATITFLCRRQRGDLIALLEQEFRVLALPELPLAATKTPEGQLLQGRQLYGAWLGCSQKQDADECLQALTQAGILSASWLVLDHYGLDAAWEAQLLSGLASDAAPRLLVIDDLADRPHLADLLLDQNFFGDASKARYASLVPEHCWQLLGPHYALLGPEYAQLHPLLPPRMELRRVLVFFGGVDPDNLTGCVLEALMAPELAGLAVDVVLGLQAPHRQAVAELVARRPHTTLHDPLPCLAGLIARADLALGAAGTTTWERASLGLPSLLVVEEDNQLTVAETAETNGAALCLGRSLDRSIIEQTLTNLPSTVLQPMSRACLKLCDGHGTRRMIDAMHMLGHSSDDARAPD